MRAACARESIPNVGGVALTRDSCLASPDSEIRLRRIFSLSVWQKSELLRDNDDDDDDE